MTSPKLQIEMNPHLIVEDISDHLLILILFRNQNKSLKECKVIKSHNLDGTRLDRINNELRQNDWDELLENMDVSAGFLRFHTMLCKCIDKHAPEVQRTVNYKKVVRDPWITCGIMNSLTKQRQMFKSQLKGDVSTFNYRWYRNELQRLIRASKFNYLHEKCLLYKKDSMKLWQLINKLIGKGTNKKNIIESLKVNNIMKYDAESITSELCEFFSTVGERFGNSIAPPKSSINEYLSKMSSSSTTLFLSPTNTTEINNLIQNLPNKNSSGHDSISNILLKKLAPSILAPLTLLFNKSLETGIFPDEMKKADVVPLYKSKEELECTNYRPISLLLTLSKLLEKIMYKRTYSFLEQTHQLYNSQYGFRQSHSCENAIMELVSSIIKGKQEGLYTLALFIDLSKAFDTVDHEVLLNKLDKYGIRGVANKWFRSYLTDRKMRVKCAISSTGKCESSEYRSLTYGAPQGLCLGPLIFLIFTNDLNNQIENSNSILFADDTTLYKTHRNLNYLKWCLEDDLTRLSDWFKANKLTMNIDKTVCVLFQKNPNSEKIDISIDNMSFSNAKEVKFLGMWLDENLSWSSHINKLILKISRNSNLISKNKMPEREKSPNLSCPYRKSYPVWHHTVGKQCLNYPNKEGPKNSRQLYKIYQAQPDQT